MVDWRGLYGEGWGIDLTPEAYSHPAKFARGLIRRIYEEMVMRDWLRAGDSILDPFGGVAAGALEAMRCGLHWTGVELEQKFVTLGQRNIEMWRARYGAYFPRWGTARLLQGDSRRLREVVASEVVGLVSSPSYEHDTISRDQRPNNPTNADRNYGQSPGQLGAMPLGAFEGVVSSPPFLQQSGGTNVTSASGPLADVSLIERHAAGNASAHAYGESDGQMQAMAKGDYEAVISSPPYESTHVFDQEALRLAAQGNARAIQDGAEDGGFRYGTSAGQLAQLPNGHYAVVVSSPPYNEIEDSGGREYLKRFGIGLTRGEPFFGPYSNNPDNICNVGDTFWSAAALILRECYALLCPGGVAAWVCKDYVRHKRRVEFCRQWQQLCEHTGFETVLVARAWVIENNGTQLGFMEEDNKRYITERKSFFRRLAERKGSPRIDFEEVIFVRKPITHG